MGKQAFDKRTALANALNTSGVAKAAPAKKEEPKPAPVPSKGAGRRRAEEAPEPQKTKKDIEAEQRQFVEENERKRVQFYESEAAKKVTQRREADAAVTYVEDRDTRKPKAVADISDYWKSDLGLLPFTPQDNVGPVDEEVDPQDRLDYLQMLSEQLAQLLRLKFHVFWSQMIYDDKVRRCLDSYLRFCLRSHDSCPEQENGACASDAAANGQDLVAVEEQAVMREISRRVLSIYVRLSRPQETSSDFISDGKFAQVIYEHNLFDIPKLIDICAIYGDSNRTAVTKIVHSAFRHQSLYHDDFEAVIQHMLDGLHQCCEPLQASAGLASGGDGRRRHAELSVEDCIAFLPDILSCFNAIFCFFPEDCVAKVVKGRLDASAAAGGDKGGGEDASTLPLAELMVRLHDAIMAMQQASAADQPPELGTTVTLLSRLLGLVLGFHMAPKRGAEAWEELLEWLRDHEEHAALLYDLGRHGLEACAMEWLASGLVDDAQFDYLETFCGPVLPPGERKRGRRSAAAPVGKAAGASGAGAAGSGAGAASSSSRPAGPAEASANDKAKIKEVQEVVGSEYGQGFVLQCLLHFGGSVPAVVGAIFDGSLPPQIAALPQGLTLLEAISQVSAAAQRPESGGLSAEEKRNVLGQASRMEAAPANAASDSGGNEENMYDDDVDDSLPVPSGFRVGAANESDSGNSAGEDGVFRDDDGADSDSDAWDPRWGKGKAGKGKGKGKGKGGGKGPVQGQTVQARRKEENKARVANHNRRDGAMRKMMRGMV